MRNLHAHSMCLSLSNASQTTPQTRVFVEPLTCLSVCAQSGRPIRYAFEQCFGQKVVRSGWQRAGKRSSRFGFHARHVFPATLPAVAKSPESIMHHRASMGAHKSNQETIQLKLYNTLREHGPTGRQSFRAQFEAAGKVPSAQQQICRQCAMCALSERQVRRVLAGQRRLAKSLRNRFLLFGGNRLRIGSPGALTCAANAPSGARSNFRSATKHVMQTYAVGGECR